MNKDAFHPPILSRARHSVIKDLGRAVSTLVPIIDFMAKMKSLLVIHNLSNFKH